MFWSRFGQFIFVKRNFSMRSFIHSPQNYSMKGNRNALTADLLLSAWLEENNCINNIQVKKFNILDIDTKYSLMFAVVGSGGKINRRKLIS